MKVTTDDLISQIFDALRGKGYVLESGLNDKEIERIETAFHAPLLPDLKLFLLTGVIVSALPNTDPRVISNDYFPDWRNPKQELTRVNEFIERMFTFDIQKSDYWNEQFGEKPTDEAEAITTALKVVRSWPPLFPVHAHRFISSAPSGSGNPVLSIWQPTDSVYYGGNLYEHLNIDFELDLKIPSSIPAEVPFWGSALGLS